MDAQIDRQTNRQADTQTNRQIFIRATRFSAIGEVTTEADTSEMMTVRPNQAYLLCNLFPRTKARPNTAARQEHMTHVATCSANLWRSCDASELLCPQEGVDPESHYSRVNVRRGQGGAVWSRHV